MSNARQKKKKNAAAAKQAATAYKGKNAPIKPAAVKKPQDISAKPVPEVPKAEIAKLEVEKIDLKKEEITKPQPEKSDLQKVDVEEAGYKDHEGESEEVIKIEAEKSGSIKIESKKSDPEKNKAKQSVTKNAEPKKSAQEKTQKKIKSKKTVSKKSAKPGSAEKKQSKKSGADSSKLKRKLGITKISAIVLAISVVIASVCVLMWVRDKAESKVIPPEAIPEYNGINISSEITLDVIEDLANQHDAANKMNREGDTDAFLYYASDELLFREKNSQDSLNLVNVSSNKCVLIASIVDEAGNVCFSSRGLLPGRMLTDIGINNQSYGKHEMTLVVAGYDPVTHELIGVQSSDLTVQVGIEEETSYVQNN